MNRRSTSLGTILMTFVVAILLTPIPLPEVIAPLRPYWVALVLIFWAIEAPDRVGMGFAFAAGIVLDLMTGDLLGRHALSLVVIAFIVARFRLRLRFFPLWQQSLAVAGLLLNDAIIQVWIDGVSGAAMPDWRYWLAPLVGMVLWPWVFLLLDRTRRRARVTVG